MSYVVNSHTGNDLDFINEYSNDVKLDYYNRNKVEKLASQIFDFQTKINNDWFAIPENKEYYLSRFKNL